MGWTLPPKLQALLGSRLRHIHVPDTPPLYAPRFLPGRIRDYIEQQIVVQREAAAKIEGPPNGMTIENYGPKPVLRAWLKTAGPPPTVLTFTRRPTYVLPKHYLQDQDTWAADYMTASLKSKLRVNFSKPPNWSRYHWIPDWHTLKKNQRPEDLDPLEHTWDPGVMIMPCAEPMYWGPGQLSIWPVIDLTDNVQRRRQLRNKFEVERLLEDTTIAVLKREYGIHAYAIPGSPGVWVDSAAPPPEVASSGLQFMSKEEREATAMSPSHRRFNTRRIATVHADVVNDITRFGISIHVGQPEPAINVWTAMRNPWVALRQHESTTSIAAELAHLGTSPHYHDADQSLIKRWIHKKSKYLQTDFDTSLPSSSGPVRAMPYSQVSAEPGNKQPAPLGMDNRDLATAWTGVFAQELGMRAGYVDHYSVVPGANGLKSELAPRGRSVGFMSRKYDGEYEYAEPFEQVDVPVVNLVENEFMTRNVIENTIRLADKDGVLALCKPIPRAVSWPLWYKQLTHVLDRSIKAEILDKRLADISKRANEDMKMKERSLIRQAELYRLQQIRLHREQQQQQFEDDEKTQQTDEKKEEEEKALNQQSKQDSNQQHVMEQEVPHQQFQQEALNQKYVPEQVLNQQPEQTSNEEYVMEQEISHQQPQQQSSNQKYVVEQEASHQQPQRQASNQEYVMEQEASYQQPQHQASGQEYDLETGQAGLLPRSQVPPTEKAISEPLANKLANINTEMQIILKQLELGGTWKRRLFNSTKDIQKTLEPYLDTTTRAKRRDPNRIANAADAAAAAAAAAASGRAHNNNNTIHRPLQAVSPATSAPTSANTRTTSNTTAGAVVNAETSGWLSNLEKAMRSSALSTEEAITANAQLTDVLDLLGHKPTPKPKSRFTSASSPSPTTPSQDAPDGQTDPLEKSEAADLAAQALRRRVRRSLDSPKLLQDWTRTVD